LAFGMYGPLLFWMVEIAQRSIIQAREEEAYYYSKLVLLNSSVSISHNHKIKTQDSVALNSVLFGLLVFMNTWKTMPFSQHWKVRMVL